MQEAIRALLRIKGIIDGLQAISQATLTRTERQALADVLEQAYDRVAYFAPQVERFLEQETEPAESKRTHLQFHNEKGQSV